MGWQVVNVVVLHAGNTIINPNGIFVYDGPPASGNLIIALAPAASTDQFTNAFIKGIQVGEATDTAQVQIIPGGGGAAQVKFPVPSLALSNTPNLAGGVSGSFADMLLSGPALATPGFRDWVQFFLFSNDGVSSAARMEFRYIDDLGNISILGSYNNTGWTLNANVLFGLTGNVGWANGIQQFLLPAGGGPFINGESFHAISLASGTTGLLSGGNGMRVKKMPWNAIWMDMEFSWTATAQTTFTFGSLPDATYYPNVTRHFPFDVTGTPTAVGTDNPRIFVPTSGGIQVIVPASTAGGTGGASFMYPTN